MSSSEARIRASLGPGPPQLALAPAPLPAVVPVPLPRLQALVQGFRETNRAAKVALLVLVVAAWAWWLAPQAIGGSAGWVLVSGKSMLPHLRTGDLVLVERQAHYRVGDVIAYHVPKGDPMAGAQVIHRIVGGDAVHGFVVKGDNRTAPDTWRPKPGDIVGAKVLRVPDAILVIEWLRSPLLLGIFSACFAFVLVLARADARHDANEAAAEGEQEPAVV